MGEAPRLLDRVRDKIRLKHYSIRTEEAYVQWIRRYILHHAKRHPAEMGAAEVEAFLTHLAVAGRVAASTQNQARSALSFLYKEVLGTELPWLDKVEQAQKPKRLPVVSTVEEARGRWPSSWSRCGRSTGATWRRASATCTCLMRWNASIPPPARAGAGSMYFLRRLLGHEDVATTMIYTHVLNRGGRGVLSPLDRAA